MKEAKKGDSVKVHYVGSLEDGTVFDTSREREPVEFKIGNGNLLKDFEKALHGMGVGQSKTVHIEAAGAYGERREDLVIKMQRGQFPKNIDATEGAMLNMRHQSGAVLDVVVTSVSEDEVVLDGNHPLAGKALNFEIELIEIL